MDENLPHALRRFLQHHDTHTAVYAGFAGFKNGAFLEAAVNAGFDILVTADKTLQFEQNLANYKIATVLLSANAWLMIKPHVQNIAAAIDEANPGSLIKVECGSFADRPGDED